MQVLTNIEDNRTGRRTRFSVASRWLLLVAVIAAIGVKAVLFMTESVPFNSDEAVIGLMAKHILEGATPAFFYGQAYMGSLDAWLTAGLFALFEPGVAWIRVLQAALYGLFVVTTWLLARRFFPGTNIDRWAVVLAVVPPILVTTYTSATLGGYGEILVLGNLCLLFGHNALKDPRRMRMWGLLGLAAGIGFWTLGLIIVYLLPIALIYIWRFEPSSSWIIGGSLAFGGFVLGSAPWWLFDLAHDGAALAALTGGTPLPSTVGQRLVGLLLLGLPALFGIRPPWSSDFLPIPLLFIGILLHLAVGLHLIVRFRRRPSPLGLGVKLLAGVPLALLAAFLITQFGIDSTGRYLLPMYLPVLLASAYLLDQAWRWRREAAVAGLTGFLVVNGWATAQAASMSGITTQFDPITRFGNEHDRALIGFLEQRDVSTGYTNYWVAYRIGFLTAEEVQLSPELPYKADLRYTERDLRIPGYKEAADSSDRIVYITTKHPTLDSRIRRAFEELDVKYRQRGIGHYHVFFNLSRPVRPDEIREFISP